MLLPCNNIVWGKSTCTLQSLFSVPSSWTSNKHSISFACEKRRVPLYEASYCFDGVGIVTTATMAMPKVYMLKVTIYIV